MNEIFEIYNSKAIKTNYKDKHEKPNKEEKALQYVKSITNLNLLDSVNLIENTNPYEYSYQIRTDYEVTNKKRKKLIEEEKVHNTFGAIKDKKSITVGQWRTEDRPGW